MDFFTLLLIWVAFSILAILLRPKIENDTGPGDFRPPEPREGEPVHVVFGTVLISPSITWFGDVSGVEVEKEVSQLWGLIKTRVPIGHDYFTGMMMVLCHGPIDAILDIFIGEKRVVRTAKFVGEGIARDPGKGWPKNTAPSLPESISETGTPTRISINLPHLFGGGGKKVDKDAGGIVGQMDLHWGSLTQGPNDYLGTFWGPDIVPHYRRIAYVVLRRMNVGRSPSMQPWRFVVRRIPNVLGQEAFTLITDEDTNFIANGAEVIYEVMADDVWGLGFRPGDIDIASFQAVGVTLFNEGLGYSGQFFKRAEAWNLIAEVLRHVNGVVYQDPVSGKIAIKLIRNDYTVSELVELDTSNSTLKGYTRGSWAEAVNESQVRYTDIARRFSDGVAQAQNLAAIQAMQGEIISAQYALKGLSTHEQAQLAVERLNRSTSVPLTRFRISTNRIAYAFHPGMPFKVTDSEYGLSEVVCRVTSVDYGSLVQGEIEVEAVQDVWDLSNRAYASPDDLVDLEPCGPLSLLVSGYDPATDPSADYGPSQTLLVEAPYWHNNSGGRAYVFVSREKNDDNYWEAFRAIHGVPREKVLGDPLGFCPTAILDAELLQAGDFTDATFTVQNAGDVEFLTSTNPPGMMAGKRLLYVNGEIMSWTTIEDLGSGQYRIGGVWRGQLDTVPAFHLAGSEVFFYYNEATLEGLDLTAPDDIDAFSSVQVWPVIVSNDGTSQALELAEMLSILIKERASAPYPPGNVRLNGFYYAAWPDPTSGDVTLSWTHRSRTGQTQMVAQHDPAPGTLEGDLDIEVLLDGAVVRTFAAVTGTSQVYTFAQRTSDGADDTKRVEFRIIPRGTGDEEGISRITPSFLMQV